jgi:hypothetical protein
MAGELLSLKEEWPEAEKEAEGTEELSMNLNPLQQ